MSRFRPVIPGNDTSNFSNTAKISMEGRTASYNRDIDTQEAIGQIVNERNKNNLTKRAQDIERERLFLDTRLQIQNMEAQSAQAVNELATRMEGFRTSLLNNKMGNTAQAEEGAANRGVDMARINASLADSAAGRSFSASENTLDRNLKAQLSGEDRAFAAEQALGERKFRTSERLSEQEFRSGERSDTQAFQSEENMLNRGAEIYVAEIRKRNPKVSKVAAEDAGSIIAGPQTKENIRALYSAASNEADRAELGRSVLVRLRNELVSSVENQDYAPISKIAKIINTIPDDVLGDTLGKDKAEALGKMFIGGSPSEEDQAPAWLPGPARAHANVFYAVSNWLSGKKPARLERAAVSKIVEFINTELAARQDASTEEE